MRACRLRRCPRRAVGDVEKHRGCLWEPPKRAIVAILVYEEGYCAAGNDAGLVPGGLVPD